MLLDVVERLFFIFLACLTTRCPQSFRPLDNIRIISTISSFFSFLFWFGQLLDLVIKKKEEILPVASRQARAVNFHSHPHDDQSIYQLYNISCYRVPVYIRKIKIYNISSSTAPQHHLLGWLIYSMLFISAVNTIRLCVLLYLKGHQHCNQGQGKCNTR